jgi:hypothetical protein
MGAMDRGQHSAVSGELGISQGTRNMTNPDLIGDLSRAVEAVNDAETAKAHYAEVRSPENFSSWRSRERNEASPLAYEFIRQFGPALLQLAKQGEQQADYIYNEDDWECTYSSSDSSELTENIELGDVMVIGQLASLPFVYAAQVVTERDENGDPEGWEVRFFDTRAEADAAVAAQINPNPPEPNHAD